MGQTYGGICETAPIHFLKISIDFERVKEDTEYLIVSISSLLATPEWPLNPGTVENPSLAHLSALRLNYLTVWDIRFPIGRWVEPVSRWTQNLCNTQARVTKVVPLKSSRCGDHYEASFNAIAPISDKWIISQFCSTICTCSQTAEHFQSSSNWSKFFGSLLSDIVKSHDHHVTLITLLPTSHLCNSFSCRGNNRSTV